MAKLLVSVRSKVEALAALAGGATIIDVKEPKNGPLGRAAVSVWREVSEVVPRGVPVSVALGELNDCSPDTAVAEEPGGCWAGLSYCKVGLSNAPRNWIDCWRDLRQRLADTEPVGPAWVAVVYVDWRAARAPGPDAIVRAAATIDACRGVLFDTWDKTRSAGIDLAWKPVIEQVRNSGRFVALAGSLDAAAIRHLAPLAPDIFAVRGSACAGGDRLGPIDAKRVSLLARAAKAREAVMRPPDRTL